MYIDLKNKIAKYKGIVTVLNFVINYLYIFVINKIVLVLRIIINNYL